jgi:hypothetical protein
LARSATRSFARNPRLASAWPIRAASAENSPWVIDLPWSIETMKGFFGAARPLSATQRPKVPAVYILY